MRVVALSILAVLYLSVEVRAEEHTKGITLNPPDKLVWIDGPASLPKGAQIAVLEGDPNK